MMTQQDTNVEWHRKLGHISYVNLRKLQEICQGLPESVSKCKNFDICSVCMQAKQVRLPFDTERSRAGKPLEIIHSDVCGPIDSTAYDNKKYFLTCVDDYMHFCKIYLLENKSEVYTFLKEYVNEAECHFNKRVRRIRCDNGGQYKNNALREWCKNKGIVMEFTTPYSPQLNGTAERMNRTIVEKARALIFDSGLNKRMWGEAVLTSAYLLNRSPTVTVNGTPAENWYGKRPDLAGLKSFGSEMYTKILVPLKKLDSHGKKGIFVGYNTNGYRIWDPNTERTCVSRDVTFTSKPVTTNKQKEMERVTDPEDKPNTPDQEDSEMQQEPEADNNEEEPTDTEEDEENENADHKDNGRKNNGQNEQGYALRPRRNIHAPKLPRLSHREPKGGYAHLYI
ncbi:hypothetical protein B7P43_G03693 [Cryptotermes secundus]|uniref:Integrase catalytic domain-containing protein n=1 Tax=Cryptotermes secundus TaxID=105785 RepID=A0A2J7PKR8_9NEOP|nr:hypothetical protein B7P43_G03693 [Cryptotermes secundus]